MADKYGEMAMNIKEDNQTLREHWDNVFRQAESITDERDWEELAPSRKLFDAAASLGSCARMLDYGCGSGWASVIAAKHGCQDITAADMSYHAIVHTSANAKFHGVSKQIHPVKIDDAWLKSIPDHTYDGFFCSNVLDVIPPLTADEIIRESARIVSDEAIVIISMNYYLSPQRAEEKGLELVEGSRLYVDGVLRMVSRTDEEWLERFSPYYSLLQLDHFAWPSEKKETRRLFYLKMK